VKSAGNDIVALNAIDIQRTTSTAFYSKFIIPEERAFYQQPQFGAVPFQNFVWLLWSVKESAYKYLKRLQPDLVFSPSKLIIRNITVPHIQSTAEAAVWESGNKNEEFHTGEVISGTHRLYFRSKITGGFIASIVNDTPGFENVYWGIKSIQNTSYEHQSTEVREFILNKLRQILSVDNLRIEKTSEGCPVVFNAENLLDIAVSFTHHGYFVAYSFYSVSS